MRAKCVSPNPDAKDCAEAVAGAGHARDERSGKCLAGMARACGRVEPAYNDIQGLTGNIESPATNGSGVSSPPTLAVIGCGDPFFVVAPGGRPVKPVPFRIDVATGFATRCVGIRAAIGSRDRLAAPGVVASGSSAETHEPVPARGLVGSASSPAVGRSRCALVMRKQMTVASAVRAVIGYSGLVARLHGQSSAIAPPATARRGIRQCNVYS